MNKHWPRHEFHSAQEKALLSQGYILPILLESVELPGVSSTIGFIRWKDFPVEEIAKMVAQKFGDRAKRPI